MPHAGLDDCLQVLRFLYEDRWVQVACCCSLSATAMDATGSCTQLLRWTTCLAGTLLDQVRAAAVVVACWRVPSLFRLTRGGRRLQQLLLIASPLKQQLEPSWASAGYLLDNERERAAAFCQNPLAPPAGWQFSLRLHVDSLRSAAFSRYRVWHGLLTRWIGLPWSFFDLDWDRYLPW